MIDIFSVPCLPIAGGSIMSTKYEAPSMAASLACPPIANLVLAPLAMWSMSTVAAFVCRAIWRGMSLMNLVIPSLSFVSNPKSVSASVTPSMTASV